MKALVALCATILLSGCGTFTTLDELEDEAMRTGDWSRVEARERSLQKWAARDRRICPSRNQTAVCERVVRTLTCECVSSYNTSGPVSSMLGGFRN